MSHTMRAIKIMMRIRQVSRLDAKVAKRQARLIAERVRVTKLMGQHKESVEALDLLMINLKELPHAHNTNVVNDNLGPKHTLSGYKA